MPSAIMALQHHNAAIMAIVMASSQASTRYLLRFKTCQVSFFFFPSTRKLSNLPRRKNRNQSGFQLSLLSGRDRTHTQHFYITLSQFTTTCLWSTLISRTFCTMMDQYTIIKTSLCWSVIMQPVSPCRLSVSILLNILPWSTN